MVANMDRAEKLERFYRRCGAKLRGKLAYCKKRPLLGATRCRLHGGLSCGPVTELGKLRSIQAMQEGKRRWLDKCACAAP